MVVPHAAPWVLTVLPQALGNPFRAGDEQDASVNVFAGGMRLSVRGEHVEWAHDLTLHPIVGHARDGDRWFFATADGALFRSTAFTGPLERVGDSAPGWTLCGRTPSDECAGFDSTGVLAVRSAEQRLFLGNGPDGLTPASAPLDRPLVDVGFVDREFGVAIVAPGLLFRTVDGGAHVERVDTGSEVPFVVYPHTDSFVLATTHGLVRLERTGTAVPFTGSAEVFDHRLSDETVHAIDESLPREDPLLWATLLAHGAILMPDDRIATIESEFLVMRERNGDSHQFPLPGASCSIHPYGSQVLASCEDDQHLRTLQTFAADRWVELRTLPSMGPLVVAVDGAGIVAMGPCSDDDARPRDTTPVCWFNGVTWQTRMLPGDAHLAGLHGDTLLFETSDPANDSHGETGSIRIARAGNIDEGESLSVAGGHLVGMAFAGNGSLAGLAERDGHLALAKGDVGAPLVLRSLPPATNHVAFVDALRGIAYGAILTDLFSTTDGGLSWSRVDLPVDGDATAVTLAPRLAATDDILADDAMCTNTYCAINARLVWSAPGVVPANGVRLLAAAHPPGVVPTAERIVDPRQQGYRIVRWSCDLRDPPPDTTRELPAGRLYGTDGWLEPHVTGAGESGAGRYTFAWGGVDDRGAFRAQARPVSIPAVDLNGASSTGSPVSNSDTVALLPRLLTRTLAILERCAGPFYAGQCDLVAIPAQGTPIVLGSDRALVGADDAVVHLRSAMALPDGGAALMLSTAFPTFASEDQTIARLDALVRVSSRGAIVARRAFTWSRGRTVRMLARNAQGVGLLVATAPAMRALAWYGIDAAHDGTIVASLPEGPLPTCTTDVAAANVTTFVSAETDYAPSLDVASARFILLPPYNLRDTLEVDGSNVCLRGMSLWSMNPADELLLMNYLGGPPRLRAAHGTLEGFALSQPRPAPMRCLVP